MFRDVRIPDVARGKRSRVTLLPSADPDDDVLLSDHGALAPSGKILTSPELKYFDKYCDIQSLYGASGGGGWAGTSLINSPPTGGGTISTPTLGDSATQRRGRGILMKSIAISGVMALGVNAVKLQPPFPVLTYVALVLDTQVDPVFPGTYTADQLFDIKGGDMASLFPPLRNMNTNTRFQVLKWEILKLHSSGFTIDSTSVPPEFSWAGDIARFEWFVHLDLRSFFNAGTTDSAASAADNLLFMVAWQTDGAQASVTWKSRLRFADLI